MIVHIRTEIEKLADKAYIDMHTHQRFVERINNDSTFTEETNPYSHFCCFFIPIDRKTQSLFLVHHKTHFKTRSILTIDCYRY